MDLRMHKLLNVFLPPIASVLLLLSLPFSLIFKTVYCLKSFVCKENVANKVVLITGASSGIGEYLAYEYAKKGARLALVARRNHRLLLVAEKANSLGSPNTIVICGDVSKLEDCKRIVDQTVNHFGQLDHLVNNAGITNIELFSDVSDFSNSRQIMDINFWGSVYVTHFSAPHLRKSKGKIIVISSGAVMAPFPRGSVYNASKAALSSFFETLKIEFGSEIKITIVFPGLIESEMTNDENISKGGGEFWPIEPTEGCAKAIVEKVCRGYSFIIEPPWMRVFFWFKQCYAHLYSWSVRKMFIRTRASNIKE